jgi:cohesin loading factor subunit SCC2
MSQCITGFLFRAQPTLMTLESSAMIMDATFASQEEEGRARLLKIMQEFLVSEATKHAHKEKSKTNAKGKQSSTEVNMEELVGNTDGFADSGYVR